MLDHVTIGVTDFDRARDFYDRALHPGDVIATGTPPGVGIGKKPNPVFAKPGQTITIGIEKLGVQTQKVVASPYAKAS